MTTSPELAVPPCYSTSSPSPIAWCPAVSIASACTGTCSSCPLSRTTDDRSSVRCRSDSGSIKTPMRTVALVPGTASSLTSTTPDTRSSPFLRNVTCPMAGPVRRDGTHAGPDALGYSRDGHHRGGHHHRPPQVDLRGGTDLRQRGAG